MREVRVFGSTSNSIGIGDFTFNEDVSDKLQVGDEFYVIIMYDEEPTWNEGQDYRLDSYIEQCEATYLGNRVFSRGTIRVSSNGNERVDFPSGIKTLDVKLSSAQAIRNAQGVDINNGHIIISNSIVNTGISLPTAEQYSGNYYLHANGEWSEVESGVTSGGSNTYIQYNDDGALGGSAGFTFDETTNNVTIANTLSVGTIAIDISETANLTANSTLVQVANSTATSNLQPGILVIGTSAINTTSVSIGGVGVYSGTGAPSFSAAKGSLYMRKDGSTTNDRMYVNTDGSTGWTAVTTAT